MNWIRRNVQPRLRAIALARTVLPVPGTSSMSRCPRHSNATSARRTSWCFPTITRSTLARTLSPVSWIFVMGLRLPSRGMCVAWGGAAGFDGCGRRRCAVPSGVMPNSTSRRKKRFRGPSLGAAGAPPLYPKLRVERAARGLCCMAATTGRSPLGRAAYLYRRRKRPNRSFKVSGDARAPLQDPRSASAGSGAAQRRRTSMGRVRASEPARRPAREGARREHGPEPPRSPGSPKSPHDLKLGSAR